MRRNVANLEKKKTKIRKISPLTPSSHKVLPLIKDLTSPVYSSNTFTLNEEIKVSPKTKKQNIPFTFTARAEDANIKAQELLNNPKYLLEKKQSIDTESTIKLNENNIIKLQEEVKSLKSALCDKCVTISKLESKIFFLNSNKKGAQPRLLIDEIENLDLDKPDPLALNHKTFDRTSSKEEKLKDVIKDQIVEYRKLEEMYREDTNQLKYDNEKLKNECQRLETECETYKQKFEGCYKAYEENNKKYKQILESQEKDIKSYQQQLSSKSNDIYQQSESIRKMHLDKIVKNETIKDLQQQLEKLTSSYKNLETERNSLKQILIRKEEEILAEKSTLKTIDDYINEVQLLKSLNYSLSETNKELQKSLEFVTMNYNELQKKFSCFREHAEDKEKILKRSISKINENSGSLDLNSIKTQEKAKFRRTLTQAMTSPEVPQIDNISRFMLKITALEDEISGFREEVDRLTKNLSYSKKIIEEKNVIIDSIKGKQKMKEQKLGLVGRLKIVTEMMTVNLNETIKLLACRICNSSEGEIFMFWPCGHILCSSCISYQELCMECNSSSRMLKIDLIKTLHFKLRMQTVNINELSSIVSHN